MEYTCVCVHGDGPTDPDTRICIYMYVNPITPTGHQPTLDPDTHTHIYIYTYHRLALRQVLELHEPQYLEELRAKRTELAVGFCNFPKASRLVI